MQAIMQKIINMMNAENAMIDPINIPPCKCSEDFASEILISKATESCYNIIIHNFYKKSKFYVTTNRITNRMNYQIIGIKNGNYEI